MDSMLRFRSEAMLGRGGKLAEGGEERGGGLPLSSPLPCLLRGLVIHRDCI